jgi:hypothetical protein
MTMNGSIPERADILHRLRVSIVGMVDVERIAATGLFQMMVNRY